MCGIAGSIGWGNGGKVREMVATQLHRGPDDRGIWCDSEEGVYLGSARLAIRDLSDHGHMPMRTDDGRYTIVYNGEIYNHRELRAHLEKRGWRFRSTSDTEVVLYMIAEHDVRAFARLVGMFAVAVWDQKERRLILARDHFGIKPLYYCRQAGRMAFASEVKALLKLPGVEVRMRGSALLQYLTFLWVPDPETMFEGIQKMEAGHFGVFHRGKWEIDSYWDIEVPPADHCFPTSEGELIEEVRDRFRKSVARQMVSDVPIGAFLSAGLDSSSIVAAMAESYPAEAIRTFTISFPERYRRGEVTIDDPAVAERTARHFGCVHREIEMRPQVVSELPKLVWHMDEPTADPAIVMAYFVNHFARSDVTVLLSGIGGDEVFGGYRKYFAHYMSQWYKRIPRFIRDGFLEPLVDILPVARGSSWKGHVRLAKKMMRSGSLPPRERFITDSVYMSHSLVNSITQEGIDVGDEHPFRRHLEHFERVEHANFLNQMLYVDVKTFMTSLNLMYNDKMSMASSVEVRVPFLDWQFMQWVMSNIPPGLKIKGGTRKHILREAMRPLLPSEVLAQGKAGFGAPIDYWLAGELREMIDDLLGVDQIKRRGLFKAEVIREMVQAHRNGVQDWSMQLWQLLTLELWMQEFCDV